MARRSVHSHARNPLEVERGRRAQYRIVRPSTMARASSARVNRPRRRIRKYGALRWSEGSPHNGPAGDPRKGIEDARFPLCKTVAVGSRFTLNGCGCDRSLKMHQARLGRRPFRPSLPNRLPNDLRANCSCTRAVGDDELAEFLNLAYLGFVTRRRHDRPGALQRGGLHPHLSCELSGGRETRSL